jgi:group I intron endonuclease
MTIKELEKDLNSRGGNLSGIYKITRKSDGKVYIGQSECITKRIIQHINNIRETNSDKIDGAIQSEGWENFTYEVELALPELNTEQLWLAESTYINKYNSYETGFNKTKGNHIGKYDHAEFTRKNVVSVDVTKRIRDRFKLILKNKKVLLINLFDDQFVDTLKYHDCEVIQISKYFESKEDLGNYIMEELKNYMNVKFDLIIANPPYGKIGANITKHIIDNIEFDEYVNLLPANDYNRNTTKDLYKYVDLDSMTPVNNGFADAAVTTHMAKITKKQHRYISWEEFQIENYIDHSLTKYFYENRNRSHQAIDSTEMSGATDKQFKLFNIDTTVIFGNRDINHRHLPYSKATDTYRYNVLKDITNAELFDSRKATRKGIYDGWLHVAGINFDLEIEKNNFVNFIYSENGFRFLAKLFTAVNIDGTINCGKVFPKVDWTRSWTVEEILKEYGYTQKEIEEVINDLVNFKGMED